MGVWNEGGFFNSMDGHVIKRAQSVTLPVLQINNDQVQRELSVAGGVQPVQTVGTDQSAATKQIGGQPDPMEVLRRIELEKEEKKQREIEEARRKVQEQEKIAAIMKAGRVDVSAFIAEGKARQEALPSSQASGMDRLQSREEKNRAQEILERLNREAEEDERKKRQEIEEAKRQAKEKFG